MTIFSCFTCPSRNRQKLAHCCPSGLPHTGSEWIRNCQFRCYIHDIWWRGGRMFRPTARSCSIAGRLGDRRTEPFFHGSTPPAAWRVGRRRRKAPKTQRGTRAERQASKQRKIRNTNRATNPYYAFLPQGGWGGGQGLGGRRSGERDWTVRPAVSDTH